MLLLEALRLQATPRPVRLALVGAGGKSTALFQLAREFLLPNPVEATRQVTSKATTVVVSATTHLAVAQAALADRHFVITGAAEIDALAKELPAGVILFTGAEVDRGRLAGVTPDVLDRLFFLAEAYQLPLLVEADGSRLRPVKAPAAHEPAIPPLVDSVVVVAGLSALGKPLTSEWVHRPEIFAELSDLASGSLITPDALVRLLSHPGGGLKNIPASARRVVLLNQADTAEMQAAASSMVKHLLLHFHAVVIAALQPMPFPIPYPKSSISSKVLAVHEPIAGIILSAGESRRLGQPKALLSWKGAPFIHHVIKAARGAGLSPLVVVSGAHTTQVQAACAGMEVQLVHNPDWQEGQSASLKVGLRSLPSEVGGAVFLLADQPQIPSGLVRLLVEEHVAGLQPIVAPLVDGRRANPVLFDRLTFPSLMALSGDVGGRALFAKYRIAWVPWHDPAILLDVDTQEDYQKLLELDQDV